MICSLRSRLAALAFFAGLLCLACRDTIIVPTGPAIATPTPTPSSGAKQTIQFRVLGNATSAVVRYSTPANGLAQELTSLPFFSTFTTTATAVFLSLQATPSGYPFAVTAPFLNVQIVVNNDVFQEASSGDFLLNTLSVSGTWRQ